MIVDGRGYFGVTLKQWATGDMPLGARVRGLPHVAAAKQMAPPPSLDQVAEGEPLAARVCHGWWIVDCPDCRGADFVWTDRPLQWCGSCGNAAVGGRWRRVVVPEGRSEIEAALLARPDQTTQNWEPGESVADLLAENAERLEA